MSVERNKAIVKTVLEGPVAGVIKGTDHNLRQHVADDVVFHTPMLSSRADHVDGMRDELRAYGEALANFDLAIDYLIGEDDLVAAHLTSGGHHHKSFRHPAGEVAPSGQAVKAGGVVLVRLREELITDVWYYANLSDAIRARALASTT